MSRDVSQTRFGIIRREFCETDPGCYGVPLGGGGAGLNHLHGEQDVDQQVTSTASDEESSGGREEYGNEDEDNV